MTDEFIFQALPILLGLFIIILFFIFGLKLQSAGDQLGNNSLRQAGNIIIFLLLFSIFVYILYYLSINNNVKEIKKNYPTIRY